VDSPSTLSRPLHIIMPCLASRILMPQQALPPPQALLPIHLPRHSVTRDITSLPRVVPPQPSPTPYPILRIIIAPRQGGHKDQRGGHDGMLDKDCRTCLAPHKWAKRIIVPRQAITYCQTSAGYLQARQNHGFCTPMYASIQMTRYQSKG
jgi:hypothetical protein